MMMTRMRVLVLLMLALMLPVLVVAQDATPTATPVAREGGRLILATTTSTVDSGLLDAILPDFEAQSGLVVDVLSVGTGQAFEIGRAGNADVLLVHDRKREDGFVEEGFAAARFDVMYNDFIVVGPQSDPAGLLGAQSVNEAFSLLMAAGEAGKAAFVSRGDDSGTHSREKKLWEAAGLTPEGDWYISAGQGMGAVLTMTNELQAYTLADRATYATRLAEGLDLVVVTEGDKALLNPYGVMAVSADLYPAVNAAGAQAFIAWITSVETQALIAEFAIGETTLFTPNSQQWLEAQAVATPEATVEPTAQS